MVESKSAIKSAERIIAYLNQQIDSKSKFYTSGINCLEDLRAYGLEIVKLSDEALKKANIQYTEENTIEKVESKPPVGVSKEFKNVLKVVAYLPKSAYKQNDFLKPFAELIYKYFSIRFNPKYDPKKIHKFSVNNYRDYLACFILAGCKYLLDYQTFDPFITMTTDWLREVQKGTVKYSMPIEVAQIYFPLFTSSKKELPVTVLDKQVLEISLECWNALWELGYYNFSKIDGFEAAPTEKFKWFESSFDAIPEQREVSLEDIL